ncbi:MAG: diguanylate cyclase [Fimbriiglobus sp.]|nr:diguanylate cyclase [Fimbriiglobus sp.]
MQTHRYKCSVLAVDDTPAVLALLTHHIGHEFDVTSVESATDARRVIAARPPDIVVTDLSLPDDSGIRLLDWVYRTAPRTARVLITGTARLQDAVDAINCGHVHRLILKPWRAEDLLTHLRAVARGLLLERSHERLLEELRTLNQELEQRVNERTEELRATNRTLERMALTDTLTGLSNRRAIELIGGQELLRRVRTPTPIAFGLIDIDRFKQINSQFLQTGGDQALIHLGRVVQKTIRGTDSVGRVGGEEFLIIAPETDAAGAAVLAERVRADVEAMEVRYHGMQIPLTISGGYSVAEAADAVSYEQMFELAAEALGEAKRGGRNRCVIKLFDATRSQVQLPVGTS